MLKIPRQMVLIPPIHDKSTEGIYYCKSCLQQYDILDTTKPIIPQPASSQPILLDPGTPDSGMSDASD